MSTFDKELKKKETMNEKKCPCVLYGLFFLTWYNFTHDRILQ